MYDYIIYILYNILAYIQHKGHVSLEDICLCFISFRIRLFCYSVSLLTY